MEDSNLIILVVKIFGIVFLGIMMKAIMDDRDDKAYLNGILGGFILLAQYFSDIIGMDWMLIAVCFVMILGVIAQQKITKRHILVAKS